MSGFLRRSSHHGGGFSSMSGKPCVGYLFHLLLFSSGQLSELMITDRNK